MLPCCSPTGERDRVGDTGRPRSRRSSCSCRICWIVGEDSFGCIGWWSRGSRGGPEKTAETAVPSTPTENVAIESKKPEETKESDSRSADPDSCLFFELECFLPVSFKNILVDWPNFLDGIFYCTAQVMLLPMKLIAGSRLWSL